MSKPARFGLWTAEGNGSVRILASPDAVRLLDLDGEHGRSASGELLERVRFEQLAELHRTASHGVFDGTLLIELRDGGERRLLARAISDPHAPGKRSLGILLELLDGERDGPMERQVPDAPSGQRRRVDFGARSAR